MIKPLDITTLIAELEKIRAKQGNISIVLDSGPLLTVMVAENKKNNTSVVVLSRVMPKGVSTKV